MLTLQSAAPAVEPPLLWASGCSVSTQLQLKLRDAALAQAHSTDLRQYLTLDPACMTCIVLTLLLRGGVLAPCYEQTNQHAETCCIMIQ